MKRQKDTREINGLQVHQQPKQASTEIINLKFFLIFDSVYANRPRFIGCDWKQCLGYFIGLESFLYLL